MSSKLLTRFILNRNYFHTPLIRGLSSKSDLKFSDKHEWIRLDGNKGTVGITDYASDKLGEVVYAELPEVGAKLAQAGYLKKLILFPLISYSIF